MVEIQQLQSGDLEKVQAALEVAREKGDIRWVRPMLEAFRDAPSQAIQEGIGEVLGTLKISEAADVFLDALGDPEYAGTEADIIGFMWNTGLTPEEGLLSVVEVGTSGDFRNAVEALTWVEQLDGVHDEHKLLESILLVRGALDDPEKTDIHSLMQPLLEVLQAFERAQ